MCIFNASPSVKKYTLKNEGATDGYLRDAIEQRSSNGFRVHAFRFEELGQSTIILLVAIKLMLVRNAPNIQQLQLFVQE